MTAPPVKKACDACHRRKVRCSGGQPCRNCGQANLQCTYLAIPQKKGPKGSRAKVISEIRDTQQHVPPATGPTQLPVQEPIPFDFNSPPVSPTYARIPGLLAQQTIDSCVNFFFEHMYPTMPIFNRQRLADLINKRDDSQPEVYCLIASLCAWILIQPGMTLPGALAGTYEVESPQNRYGYASMLIDDLLRVRKGIDYVENPTLISVQTSLFIFSSYFGLEKQNAGWFHLREAATLAQLLSMHEESTYLIGDAFENIYKRRTYWLLLVTERAYAMERHRPLSLHATIELPAAEGPHEEEVIAGFLYLICLFRCIDDEFMGLWNKAKSECSTGWLSRLQKQLVDALPPDMKTTESQAADIRVTQQWLRVMVWQLSITNGYLSSSSTDSAMTFKYPIEIAKDLIQDVQRLSLASMEVHGVGFIEKLFDVACTLTDVIACVPLESDPHSMDQPFEYLNQFLNLISQLRNGASRYLPLLLAKVSENLPSMVAPIHHMPLSIKQGYSGACDGSHNGISTPMAPPPPSSSSPNSTAPHHHQQQQHAQHSQQAGFNSPSTPNSAVGTGPPSFHDHSGGLMFDTYSPSAHTSANSDVAMTPPLGTPQGYSVGPVLAPIPRSVPTVGGIKFDGYPG